VLITGLLRYFFHDAPPPNFADLYLAAVLVLAYRCSWKAGAALAGASFVLAVYMLAPLDAADRFHLFSFAACAGVIVLVSAAIQRRRA
jgi:hypothetical protein